MKIRVAIKDDAKEIAEIYAYYVRNSSYSFDLEPLSPDEFEEKIERIKKRYPFFVCEENGNVIGFAYASPYKEKRAYLWIAETTIYVKKDTLHKGAGTLLYNKLLDALTFLGYTKAVAVLGLPNEASARFHEKMGFRFVAEFHDMGYKLDAWHGISYYVRDLNPSGENMSEPECFDEKMG
jgi:phosphinothricin acetyltransferase